MTVLVYKKGERDDPSNWRPISLCSTISKLYASCLASRITERSVTGGAISSTQKGFMSCEGCYEHHFVLQTTIETALRARRQCTVACLDLANAFGSMTHHHIFATLQEFGMPENFLRVIREGYEGCSPTIRSVEGETTVVPIRSGVKQGCPLSPIIFNLAMEPLLRAISNGADGFNLHSERVSILAYADDLVLTADDPENLQSILDATSQAADWMGLRFNAKKCVSLHIDGSKRDSVQTTGFQIQGEPVIPLAEGQAYRAPSNQETTSFLSGSLDGEFGRDGRDIASLWSGARSAMHHLGKRIGCRWELCEERQELGVPGPQIRSEDNTIVTPSARGMLERTLKAAIHSLYMEALKHKPDQ
ncbi:unnamed protein product, partial [Lepidochelys kempii]